jgi:hypothetical protein
MTVQTSSPSLPPGSPVTLRKPLIRRAAGAGYRAVSGRLLRFGSGVLSSARVIRNLTHRTLNQSDYHRWTSLNNYEAWWDARTQKIARLVPPGSRVIEFGAGRRQLEKFLDPSCTYVASDLVERGPETFVCDLNRYPLPDLRALNIDTAVFGGVLEYMHDMESLVSWLAQQVSLCVASYSCTPDRGMVSRLQEKFDRMYYGYMNSYMEAELVGLFRRAGFQCIARDRWTTQQIFLFRMGSDER